MKNVGLRGNPAVIDMTTTLHTDEQSTAADNASPTQAESTAKNSAKPGLLPPNLVVSELVCTPEEKDTYTYYILQKVRSSAESCREMFGRVANKSRVCVAVFGSHPHLLEFHRWSEKDSELLVHSASAGEGTSCTGNCPHGVWEEVHALTSTGLLLFQMQQRQRLKTMDFFRSNENAILVATDVAARGLDFPDVQVMPKTFSFRCAAHGTPA